MHGKGQEPSFDPAPYREGLKRRRARYEQALEERIREAHAFLKELVEAFRTIDPDVQKIVLFGSLAWGKPKRLDFDIDVAVRSERYLKLVSWTLDQTWKIDLVDLDQVSGSVLEGLEETGVVLYEKS